MSALNILVVAGSLNDRSATRSVTKIVAEEWRKQGCAVDEVDLAKETLALFDPDSSYNGAIYLTLKPRVDQADVIVLGTPDYHGTISSPLKNFLDHFWQEFAGKLFATIVASYDKGLTVTDQLRTIARQCYAWSLPYGVSFMEEEDVNDREIVSEPVKNRLEMMVRDI